MQSWPLGTPDRTGIHDLQRKDFDLAVRPADPDDRIQSAIVPPGSARANLNTCAFDGSGDLWFTGQNGVVGKVAVRTGQVSVKPAPRGHGPYGICATPAGDVWWCSLAQSFIARYPMPRDGANIRQILGRPGEVWLPESGTEHITVIRT